MIVRLSFVKSPPEQVKEARDIWDNQVAPALKKQRGFRGAYRAASLETPGEGVTIQFWESKEDLEAWHSSKGYKELIGRLRVLMVELPATMLYEVSTEI